MTIAFRQLITKSENSSAPMTVVLPSDPLVGSALIIVVGCSKTSGISRVRTQLTEEWNLLFESDGPVDADEQALEAVRVQIWGAFDIPNGMVAQIGIEFSGGTSERGLILAEYTGDVFQFPNPADRVIGGTDVTPPATEGTIEISGTKDTREAEELFVGAAAVDQDVSFIRPEAPFSIRSQTDIGSPSSGRIALLDFISSATRTPEMLVDHEAFASSVNWAGVMAAIRGILQVPATAVVAPAVSEPVTEFTDYSSDGIGKLIAQLRAKA